MQGVAIGLVVKEALLGIVWRYLTDKGLYGEEHSVGEFGFLKTNIFGETSYFSELWSYFLAGDARFLGAIPFCVVEQCSELVEYVQVKDGHLAKAIWNGISLEKELFLAKLWNANYFDFRCKTKTFERCCQPPSNRYKNTKTADDGRLCAVVASAAHKTLRFYFEF